MIAPSQRIGDVKSYYFATKLAEIRQLNTEGKAIVNLGIGSPDLPPPDAVIKALQVSAAQEGASRYQSYSGIAELREAFATFYKRHFATKLDSQTEILPLIGSKEGIMHISMAFISEGDEVLVPNPGYPAYAMCTKLAGGTIKHYDLNADGGWLPDLEALARQDLSKVKLMWVNYPHMPTGAVASEQLFSDLVAFGKANNILICHDSPYAFILNDKPSSILSTPGAMDTALELTSLSKCFNMSGWRVGAVAGNATYIQYIMRFKSNMDSGMYKPIQLAAVEALNSPNAWFEQMNAIYRKRRQIAWKIFDLLGCQYSTESSGLFVWAKVGSNDAGTWSDKVLYDANVFITPGFIFGSNGNQYLRIALCSDEATLEQAYHRISASL